MKNINLLKQRISNALKLFPILLVEILVISCTKNNAIITKGYLNKNFDNSSFAASSVGTTYYVNLSGNDSNSGTSISTPWKSISKVNSTTFNPGDQILFQGGQTFIGNIVTSSSGSSSIYIRYGSYGSGKAYINGVSGTGIYVYNKSNIWIDSLIIYGGFNKDSQAGNNGYGIEYFNDLIGGVVLGNCKITNCDVSGFKNAGIQFLDYASDNSQGGFSQIIAYHNNVHDNAIAGISSSGGYPPVAGSNAHSFSYVYIGYNYVFNNLGYKPGNGTHTGDGIVIGDAAGGVIEHNVSYNNGWNNTNNGGGPAGIWCWDSKGITIQYNEAYNNGTMKGDGDGFDLDGGTSYCTLQYNYSHNNYGAGILVWEFGDTRISNSNNTIRYNISHDDAYGNNFFGGITIGVNNGTVTNNNFYNNTICSSVSIPVKIYTGTGNNFYNNIFYGTSAYGILASSGGVQTAWFLNNDYYGGNNGVNFYIGSSTFTSLGSFRSSYNETYNGTNYGYALDPSMQNPSGAGTINTLYPNSLTNFQLNSNSPMINSGFNLTTFGFNVGSYDFNGLGIPNGGAYDIGACEYH